jgi:hypothetical protein
MFENIKELENNTNFTKYISVYENVNILAEANNSVHDNYEVFDEKLNEYAGRCDGKSWSI